MDNYKNQNQWKTKQILLPNLPLPHVLDRRLGRNGNHERWLESPRICLIDEGGTCYEDYDSKTHDEALQKAEKHLREVESKRFDKESREALEEEYRELGL